MQQYRDTDYAAVSAALHAREAKLLTQAMAERMIDAAALSQMKDGALLINTARGTLVDERAVADALRSGKLAGFGADVVAVEPMRPDNPLLEVRDLNVAITPHIAWAAREARQRLMDILVDNLRAFQQGSPRNVVN